MQLSTSDQHVAGLLLATADQLLQQRENEIGSLDFDASLSAELDELAEIHERLLGLVSRRGGVAPC